MTQFKDKRRARRRADRSAPGSSTTRCSWRPTSSLYDTDKVPVGDDQRQHLELTPRPRDPLQPPLRRHVRRPGGRPSRPPGARIMDLQDPTRRCRSPPTRPQGTVSLLDDEKAITKKHQVARSPTPAPRCASTRRRSPASRTCSRSSPRHRPDDRRRSRPSSQGAGYGALKTAVADAVVEFVAPIQARYAELAADPAEVDRCSPPARPGRGRSPAPYSIRAAAGLLPPRPPPRVLMPTTSTATGRCNRPRRSGAADVDTSAPPGSSSTASRSSARGVRHRDDAAGGRRRHPARVVPRGWSKALSGKRAEITAFFISFVVVGNYCRAPRFFAHLKAASPRLMLSNLVYLAAIAFTPYPTALDRHLRGPARLGGDVSRSPSASRAASKR